MNRIYFLFVLFLLLQYAVRLKAQEIQILSEDLLLSQENLLLQSNEDSKKEISFYYDKIVGNLSSQLEGDQLLENLSRQVWNQSSSSWVNDSLYEYSYNNQNLVDTSISHKWRNGTVWGNEFKDIFSYDSNNRLIFKNHWIWGGGWYETARDYYSYIGNGNLHQITVWYYNGANWLDYTIYTYSWNASNFLTMIVTQGRDMFHQGNWVYTWKDEFYYDSTTVLIMKTGFNHYNYPDWKPEINDLYFYDNIGNKTENMRQDWNSTDSIWINDYRYLYEHDLNNVLLSIIYQDWKSDSLDWENVWRETYTYTPQNKIATMFKETWTPETGWNNYVSRTYFYNNNNNWTEKLTQLWDGSDWKNYYRHLAIWLEPVGVQEEQLNSDSYYLFNNYPNPFNPETKIRFQIPDPGVVSLKVYDVLGNEIATLVNERKPAGEYEIEFSGRNLPSGIYFYTLIAGNPSTSSGQVFSETKKMILLK